MTSSPRAAVVVFPGSNREGEFAHARRQAYGEAPRIVWHDDCALPEGTDLVVMPGGFAYGDYLRCGAIAARTRVMGAVAAHADRGGLVLGICNGFQILCEAGLLPGVLMRNSGRRFICKMQHLRVETDATPFTRGYSRGQIVKFAIAHGEGNYMIDTAGLAELERSGRVAFRYCDAEGRRGGAANPNGSMNDIAGVYSKRFNVLGLMPHPENLIDPLVGGVDGRPMFAAMAAAPLMTNL
jgi:phosphoribosylformylglycinamidine synthase subunit PurQ / glutaminase